LAPNPPPDICRYELFIKVASDSNRIVSVTVTLDEGIYYIWVGQQNWDILNCEDENSAYWMSLVCSPVNEDSPAVMRKKDDFDISLLRKEK